MNSSNKREIGFLINDVARLLRTNADQKAAQFGITRAQWAVLVRLARHEGLKQAELAEMLDLQPIGIDPSPRPAGPERADRAAPGP